jgi:hypothetical protein
VLECGNILGGNGESSNGVIQWNVSFFRVVQDWEVDLVLAFFVVLYSFRWREDSEDCIWWIPSKRKKFEVWPFFHELSTLGSSFFSCSVWKVKVPLRASVFVWTIAHGKILTFDNLRKRRVIVVE